MDTPEHDPRLDPPEGIVRVVIDTDTYNEIDDQFAVAHALLSPEKFQVQAIHAAPFHNDRSEGPADGMHKSYDEILRLLERINLPAERVPRVCRGADAWMPDHHTPVASESIDSLIELANADDGPLYLIALGALTNVSSALVQEPSLAERLIVVWLGGQPLTAQSAREFNLNGDLKASQVLFDNDVPLILCPCGCVAGNLLTTIYELEAHLGGRGPLCDYLIETFRTYHEDHFAWAKEIWDLAPGGWLINPQSMPSLIWSRPALSDERTWVLAPEDAPRKIRVGRGLWRNPVFANLFQKLQAHEPLKA